MINFDVFYIGCYGCSSTDLRGSGCSFLVCWRCSHGLWQDIFEAGLCLCNLVIQAFSSIERFVSWMANFVSTNSCTPPSLPKQAFPSPEVTNFHPLACAGSGANMEGTWKLLEVRQCGVPGWLLKKQRGNLDFLYKIGESWWWAIVSLLVSNVMTWCSL